MPNSTTNDEGPRRGVRRPSKRTSGTDQGPDCASMAVGVTPEQRHLDTREPDRGKPPTAGDIYDVLDAILDDVGENRVILAGERPGTGILVARVCARLDA